MNFSYFDEAGDDGFPLFSSPLFVLTGIYFDEQHWKQIYQEWGGFRREIKNSFRIPQKTEFHTRDFLLNKNPYTDFHISDSERLEVVDLFLKKMSGLQLHCINVAIDKTKILTKNYPVLENAMNYSIQRIENDLSMKKTNHHFLIIADEGRIGKMTQIARKIQKINYIPSKFTSQSYRKEISLLLEDPLPKNSAQSYFIQMGDMIATVVYMYLYHFAWNNELPNRLSRIIDKARIGSWMETLIPILNQKASSNPYGIVIYPK